MRPDLIIKRNEDDRIYLKRWYIIPRNKWFNIYLHKFEGSDDDRALHDHPWWSLSFLLKGTLSERYERAIYYNVYRRIRRFVPYLRSPKHMHRMILWSDSAWTLFFTGPAQREWGFRVPPAEGGDDSHWMEHSEFTTRG